MTDRDYENIAHEAYRYAHDFLLGNPGIPLDILDDEIHPEVFGPMLEVYWDLGASDISGAIHDGIARAHYDDLRDGYGAVYFD
jgi:hypothetical protein